MKLIAHRGLFDGPDSTVENTVEQIELALSKGYDVELDVWQIGNTFYLGHDKPESAISASWLENSAFWIHAKNTQALDTLRHLNVFWHQSDDYTLTSAGFIWCYPGKSVPITKSILVMPESAGISIDKIMHTDYYGVCSDYVGALHV